MMKSKFLINSTTALVLLSGFILFSPLSAMEDEDEDSNRSVKPFAREYGKEDDNNNSEAKPAAVAADDKVVEELLASLILFQNENYEFVITNSSILQASLLTYFQEKRSEDKVIEKTFGRLRQGIPSLFNKETEELKETESLKKELKKIYSHDVNDKELKNLEIFSTYLAKKIDFSNNETKKTVFASADEEFLNTFLYERCDQTTILWTFSISTNFKINMNSTNALINESKKRSPQDFFQLLIQVRNEALRVRADSIDLGNSVPLMFNGWRHRDVADSWRRNLALCTYDTLDALLDRLYPASAKEWLKFRKKLSSDFLEGPWKTIGDYKKQLNREQKLVADAYLPHIYKLSLNSSSHLQSLASLLSRKERDESFKGLESQFLTQLNKLALNQFGKSWESLVEEGMPKKEVQPKRIKKKKEKQGEQRLPEENKNENSSNYKQPDIWTLDAIVQGEKLSKKPVEKERKKESKKENFPISNNNNNNNIRFDDIDFGAIEEKSLRTSLEDLSNPQKRHDTESIKKIFIDLGAKYDPSTGSSHHKLTYEGKTCTIWKIHGFRDHYSPKEVAKYKDTLLDWFGRKKTN